MDDTASITTSIATESETLERTQNVEVALEDDEEETSTIEKKV